MRQLLMVVLAAASTLLVGCAAAQSEHQMYKTASALTKLSSAVEATVRRRNPPVDLTDDQLLRLATADDPALLSEFERFELRVLREERRAVVLVCDQTSGTDHDYPIGLNNNRGLKII